MQELTANRGQQQHCRWTDIQSEHVFALPVMEIHCVRILKESNQCDGFKVKVRIVGRVMKIVKQNLTAQPLKFPLSKSFFAPQKMA
jgi:hypothetical protein